MTWREWMIRRHLPEYACEFLGTALLLLIGVGAVTMIWGTDSPFLTWIPSERLRLLLTGTLFAGGATLVVYSRLGQRSGAHINPAVTIGFWMLRRLPTRDALAYIAAQAAGALAGAWLVLYLGGEQARSVRLAMTGAGPGYGLGAVFAAEVVMTAMLMGIIIICLNKTRLAPRTGIFAGSLVALMVTFGAPISGTSVNPARSLAPAMLMGDFEHLWIYLVAPVLGSVLAVNLLGSRFWGRIPLCAKLYHTERYCCAFDTCGHQLFRAGEEVMREGEPGDLAYVIHRGSLEVRRQDSQGRVRVLAVLGEHEWVGEMALLLNQPRTATVVALTDAQLRPISRDNLEQVIAEDPETTARILRQMATRLGAATRQLAG